MADFWEGGGRGGEEGEASGSYVGGGAGGKLRTLRSARRAAATPYDRPQRGRHAPAAVRAAARGDSDSSSWLRRVVVDPASRLINNGAVKWFNSVFRKRALLPPDHTQGVQEERLREVEDEAAENAVLTNLIDKEGEVSPVERQRSESEIAGLEQLLKNKTLSREKFNCLIGLLQSRVVDNSPGMENYDVKMREDLNGRNEPNRVQIAESQRWQDERKKAREVKDNLSFGNGLFSDALSPSVIGNVCDDVRSTPVDIAKAFMGLQSHRAPTSTLHLQHRLFGDESTPCRLFRDAYTPDRPNAYQLVPRTTDGKLFGNGQVEDRLKTPSNRLNSLQYPRSQNRGQGQNHTPYAKNFRQQAHSEHIGDGTPISTPASQWTPIQSPLTGGRQMLKKRSGSVLDDGMTSGRPMRRIRQKTSVCTALRNSDPSCSTSNQLNLLSSHANDFGQKTVAGVAMKPMETEKHKLLSALPFQEEGTKTLTSNLGYVPQESSETARKILEHLERMVPSPKEKSVESLLATARSKSPTRLNVSMLNGRARRSTETVDNVPFLDMHEQSTFSFQGNHQSRAQETSYSEQTFEGNGQSPLNSLETSEEPPKFHGTGDVALQHVDAGSSKVDMKLQVLYSPPVPDKNKGFRMSLCEESDEEDCVSENATIFVNSQTGNGTFTSHGNSTDVTTLKGDKAISSIRSSEANTLTDATSVVVESPTNSSEFTFPVVSATGFFPEPPTPTVIPSPLCKGNAQPVTDYIAPTYNFGSTSTSKGPDFSSSTSACTDVDTSKPEFDFKFERKPEEAFSTAVAAAVSTSPHQTSLGSSEPLVSVFKGASDPVFSENIPSVSSSNSNFSTSTVAIPALGITVFSGPVSKTDGNSSVSFLSPGTSALKGALANNNSCMMDSNSGTHGGASCVVVTENLVRSLTSGEKSTIKSESASKASNFSPCGPLLDVTSAAESTVITTSGTKNSKSNFVPNSQSAFAGSLFEQASSSSAAIASASFIIGSSTSLGPLSSSPPSGSLFSNSPSVTFGSTSPVFGSAVVASVSSCSSGSSGSSGLTASSSSSSCSLPSAGLSTNPFGVNTPAPLFSSRTAANGIATTTTYGVPSNPSLGLSGTYFGGSSASSSGVSITPQFGSTLSVSFGLSTTLQSNTSSSCGLSTTPQFGSNASSLFGSSSTSQFVSNSTSSVPSMIFSENTTPCFATGSRPSYGSGSTSIFSSGSTFGSGNSSFGGNATSFASSSSTALGGSGVSFSSASTSPFGGSIASFGSSSLPVSGGSSSLFGSSNTPMFGSNNNPPFGVAQFFRASSAASSSQLLAHSSGSGFGSTPALGSTGFSFGGSVAASSSSFPVGTSSGTSPSTYTFGSKDTTTLAPQSMFGLTNSNPTFGATTATPLTDQMEDSMAEDLTQVSAPTIFSGQAASSAPGFMFSQQSVPPSFMFNSQPSPQVANPYAAGGQGTFTPPGGALEFSGGSFSLGATGEKPGRKFVKIKRDRGRKK
ncbi:nuclear pore complex protein NUP1 isoform X2 [Cryptomeria japonica]|uniref:nuclear pore complex protein NUP1 isoform X2 n=1 Tax=Cryptomeria japonica TaxID=3369 RepID=UPI0027DA4326|nr:nuclear pore complex protein NUP1 isoform X2 [Cryptomeria japonica]